MPDFNYLNNSFGDQAVVQGWGNTLNNNLSQLVHLRQQQDQFAQEQALKAAMLALERQKMNLQAPLWAAQTGLDTQQAEHYRIQALAQQNLMRDQQAMQKAVAEQYLYSHPVHQPMQPPLPMGNDLFLTTNMGAALANQGAPVSVDSPYRAAISGEADSIRNAAVQKGLAANAMLANPQTAAMLYNNVQLRPDETVFNPVTDQAIYTAPDPMKRERLSIMANEAESREMYRQEHADYLKRMAGTAEVNAQSRARTAKKLNQAEFNAALMAGKEIGFDSEGDPYIVGDTQVPAVSVGGPKPGEVRAGKGGKQYRFKGGDQYDRNNWEEVK